MRARAELSLSFAPLAFRLYRLAARFSDELSAAANLLMASRAEGVVERDFPTRAMSFFGDVYGRLARRELLRRFFGCVCRCEFSGECELWEKSWRESLLERLCDTV